ncbi:hypothetical protein GCM10009771_17660 [Nesterenkonia flava]
MWAPPPGSLGLRQGAPVPQGAEENEVQKPVQHRLLAGFFPRNLLLQQRYRRTAGGLRNDQHPRQRAQKSFRHTPAGRIRPCQQGMLGVQPDAAGAQTQRDLFQGKHLV